MTSLSCPQCGCALQMPDLLRSQVEAETRRIRADELRKAEERFARQASEAARQKDEEIARYRKKAAEGAAREAELLKLQRQVEDRERELQLAVERRVAEEGQRIRALEAKAAQERTAREVKALQERLAREADERLAQQVQQVSLQAKDQQRLLEQERLQQIAGLQSKVDDLQRKLAQGSQQLQGEAQEVVLRELLAQAFVCDTIEDVPKGINGADLLHRVLARDGRVCGTIAWESKRTKAWSPGWLAKLREDQRAANAELAVIVTQALPEGVRHFDCIDGVWVCSWACATALGMALRTGLLDLAQARRAAEGSADKAQHLYRYLTGPEFKNQLTGLAETLTELRADLDHERRAMQKRWKLREALLERSLQSFAGVVGRVHAVLGAKLGELPLLDLEPADELPPPRPALPALEAAS